MKTHYFEQAVADTDDFQLGMAKMQGYVPQGCLLGGMVVMAEVSKGDNPCWGCEGPREKCGGKPKRNAGVPETQNDSPENKHG
jgi:hypothetical protein